MKKQANVVNFANFVIDNAVPTMQLGSRLTMKVGQFATTIAKVPPSVCKVCKCARMNQFDMIASAVSLQFPSVSRMGVKPWHSMQ